MWFKYFIESVVCLYISLIICPVVVKATDSTGREGYKQWTNYTPALRIGAGLQPKLYIETGVCFHKYYYNDLAGASSAFYGAVEWSGTMYGDRGFLLVGPKVGYEFSSRALMVAAEAKYQSDGRNKDFVLTPKIGLSLMGIMNLMYGYNIAFNKLPFPGVMQNQFSLVFNLYRKPFTKR